MKDVKFHPVHSCYDGVFNTCSGAVANILNPNPDDIVLEDIARGLSNTCRFGGQIHSFYSVAAHTLLVWHLVPKELKAAALLHDASEAYIGDVIKPLKVLLPEYEAIEAKWMTTIFKKYGVDISDLEKIKPYDRAALEFEHNYFRTGDHTLIKLLDVVSTEIMTSSRKAYSMLLILLKANFKSLENG